MPQARLIDGKVISAALRIQVAAAVAELGARHDLRPGLTVVQVGEDPASSIYVRNKGIATLESGMRSDTVHLPDDTTQAALLEVVRSLNADARVHGILVQFPVPPQISQRAVLAAIHPDKDVDGLTVVNAGRLASGEPGLVSCTPLGCMLLLREALGDLRGRRAVVLGRSNLVGKPVAQLLLAADCTVTVAHSRTADLPAVCREADVLVAAVGRPEMVRGDWIAPSAAVIDVGINRVPSRDPAKAAAGAMRVVGDVAFDEVREVAGWITPVPGGVGPMTIACLLRNTVTAACLQTGLPDPFAR